MLQAMNTGHDGSITTVHANSARDALARIETMALMAGMDLPLNAIRTQIASAIDIVVHQSRLGDGTRKVTSISEVTGIEGEVITMQEIFAYESFGKVDGQGRFTGRFKPTGIIPYCLGKIRYHGVPAYDDWFVQ
jgi:pilus assembly protein CpaF